MLSIEDLYKEIGKNIYICPLNIENFRDNSIDLTASEFAWTTDGEDIYDSASRTITVPPHKTACIYTKESIYVSEKIGGTYHSRVSIAQKGFGHIGTMLDPTYCGQSLIMLHNITDNPSTINEGERIVSIVFHYLDTPIGKSVITTPPSHTDKITPLDKTGRYRQFLENAQWVNNPLKLKTYFNSHFKASFETKKKEYSQKKKRFERLLSMPGAKFVARYLISIILVGIAYLIILNCYPPTQNNLAEILIPGILFFAGMIASDLSYAAK